MATDQHFDRGLMEYLAGFVTEHKRELISTIIENRTRHFALVLEDIYQPQNASATLRTCECLGIQDIYVIENRNRYRLNPGVTLGSSKWIDLHRYNDEGADNTRRCIEDLKQEGYRVVATVPGEDALAPHSYPLAQKSAFLFGTEEVGLSDVALSLADERLQLPMFGFTQSYNLSVSVGIALSRLVERLHESDVDWRLTDEEKQDLRLGWYRKIVRNYEALERDFLARRN